MMPTADYADANPPYGLWRRRDPVAEDDELRVWIAYAPVAAHTDPNACISHRNLLYLKCYDDRLNLPVFQRQLQLNREAAAYWILRFRGG